MMNCNVFSEETPAKRMKLTTKSRIEEILEGPEDIASAILSHLPHRDRYLAPVSQTFRDIYRRIYPECITLYKFGLETPDTARLCKLEQNEALVSVHPCDIAASNGYLETLQWLRCSGDHDPFRWNEETCFLAAKNGQLQCLQYAHENGCPLNYGACVAAIQYGHLACFQYIMEHEDDDYGDMCSIAAEYGQLECLIYAYEQGFFDEEMTEISRQAAQHGHLACLKYLKEVGCPLHEDLCRAAAEAGAVDCLQYAHENGCPLNEYTSSAAASCGKTDCLRYAHEHGCPWNEQTSHYAITSPTGSLDCLRYCHKHGCPWDESICDMPLLCRNYENLDRLRYAYENKFPGMQRALEGWDWARLSEEARRRSEEISQWTLLSQRAMPRHLFLG